jgi:hypothetical protein
MKQIPARYRQEFLEELADRIGDGVAIGPAILGYWETLTDFGRKAEPGAEQFLAWGEIMTGRRAHAGEVSLSELSRGAIPDIERAFLAIAEQEKGTKPQAAIRAAAAYSRQAESFAAASRSTFAAIIPWAITCWFTAGSVYLGEFLVESYLGLKVPYEPYQQTALSLLFFLIVGFAPIAAVLALLKIGSYWFMPNWTGPLRAWCDRRVPGFISYRRYHGLGLLSGIAYLMGTGKSTVEALWALRAAVSPWSAMYLDRLYDHCSDEKGDLLSGLDAIGGEFPDDRLVRRLHEAAKGAHFANRATEVLNREIKATAERIIERYKQLYSRASVTTMVFSLLCVALQMSFSTATQNIQFLN